MQNKKIKTEIIMLPVPAELFLEAGMFEGDPMQMYADGHKIVIENIDNPKDIVCDGDCENCPIITLHTDLNRSPNQELIRVPDRHALFPHPVKSRKTQRN